ncbi:GNAT family N-acetyltransferase [Mariniflexile jejuense]|uniref:GNAT family N-acetyltransferase n=1 Tax=Mariniflexile jejuense TaxID=1173582 RepID=A0ABW3JJH3_9FLAO
MNLSITLCNLSHLEALVEISRNTFINAFEKDNNPVDFLAYVNNAFSEDSIKKELLNPNMSFYFLYLDNQLVGYFKLNEKEAQTENLKAASIELERIYVISTFQGKKIGEFMINQAITISIEKNAAFLWLGVWEKNVNAIRFYERIGFKKFGSHNFYIGADKQIDLLYKLDLKQKERQ